MIGMAAMIRVPPAMQALVEIAKLDPKQGDGGTIKCPQCRRHTFNWWRSGVGGKLSGHCECGLKLPRA